MAGTALVNVPRGALFAVVLAVLVLDLWTKQWAVTQLASPVHPLVATAADGATVQAALAARGLGAEEIQDARTTGTVWRYRKATGLHADAVLTSAETDLDLIATAGTGLPAPRRLHIQPQDIGKKLSDVVAAQWRLDAAQVQAVLDNHTLQADARVSDPLAPIAAGDAVVLRDRSVPLIDRFMSLVYAENFGAAWSFLSTAPAMARHLLFVSISTIASLLMGWALWHGRMGSLWSSFALAAIMGGAVGNLIDRVRYHAVVDFIYNYIYIGDKLHGWPVYNVADIGITCGVIAIALEMLLSRQPAVAKA